MRYLVLIASNGPPLEIRYRELQSARKLRDGDRIVLDELMMRVRNVLSSTDAEHDAVLICGQDEPG
jgi:hypothetical protein